MLCFEKKILEQMGTNRICCFDFWCECRSFDGGSWWRFFEWKIFLRKISSGFIVEKSLCLLCEGKDKKARSLSLCNQSDREDPSLYQFDQKSHLYARIFIFNGKALWKILPRRVEKWNILLLFMVKLLFTSLIRTMV